MRLLTRLLLLALLALTVVPGRKSLIKAQHQPAPQAIQLTLPNDAEPALKQEARLLGCRVNSAPCLCYKADFFPRLLTNIQQSCDPAARAAVKAFAEAYCGFDPTTTQAGSSSLATETTTCSDRSTLTNTSNKSPTTTLGGSSSRSTEASTSTTSSRSTRTAKPADGKMALGGVGRVEAGLGLVWSAVVSTVLSWAFAWL